jgi:hypothetical protein
MAGGKAEPLFRVRQKGSMLILSRLRSPFLHRRPLLPRKPALLRRPQFPHRPTDLPRRLNFLHCRPVFPHWSLISWRPFLRSRPDLPWGPCGGHGGEPLLVAPINAEEEEEVVDWVAKVLLLQCSPLWECNGGVGAGGLYLRTDMSLEPGKQGLLHRAWPRGENLG